MAQTGSNSVAPGEQPSVVATPFKPKTLNYELNPLPVHSGYDLQNAPDHMMTWLTRIGDVLTKKKIDLYRPGEAAELPGFNPKKKTIFIEVDNLLAFRHPTLPPTVSADAVFSVRKRDVIYPKIRTKPFPTCTYERLPDKYAMGPYLRGLPFLKGRLDQSEAPLYVFLRGCTREFLRTLRHNGAYQVIAFTRMKKEQADTIIDFIEGRGPESSGETFFDGRLYQENCCWVPVQPGKEARRLLHPEVVVPFASNAKRVYYVKSLANAVPSSDPKHCIILDSDAASCAAHLRNSFCLTPFFGGKDECLLSILTPLMTYAQSEDIREVIMKGELYRAWMSYQLNERHLLPDLSKEGDGGLWELKNPILYEREVLPETMPTGRKISFGGISFQDAPSKSASSTSTVTPVLPPTVKKLLRSILAKKGQPSQPPEDVESKRAIEIQTTKAKS